MVQHYSPKTFLRQTSNAILQACFERQDALKDVPWSGLPEHQINVVYDRWQDLPESQRLATDGDGHTDQRRIFAYDGNRIVLDFWRNVAVHADWPDFPREGA